MANRINGASVDLLDIDDVAPRNAADEVCLAELKAVLDKHRAAYRFGVTLLHRHFDVADGEVLVEECDAANRVLTIRPQSQAGFGDHNSIETSWRLDGDIVMGRCMQVCAKSMENGSHIKKSHLKG